MQEALDSNTLVLLQTIQESTASARFGQRLFVFGPTDRKPEGFSRNVFLQAQKARDLDLKKSSDREMSRQG